eukprot:TRINITY_DN20415_c0_g1_i1.p2 TRINITY_DN20415_c0_g1~~TRINITY_DN20415_c0_g1_i1.p2  ORF type:complete len:202 (+),score=71.83 TRINITY_DN20415_c0_g1_i1:89-694(+)
MGNLPCCEIDVTGVTLAEMKKKIEDKGKIKVKSVPETYVTVEELVVKDGGAITFAPNKFKLQNIEFQNFIEITGSKSEIVKQVAADQAGKAMDKAGVTDAASKAMGMMSGVMGGGGSSPSGPSGEVQSFKLAVTVDLERVIGEETVRVTVKDFKSDMSAVTALFSVDAVKKFLEDAISKKATEVATRMQNDRIAKVTGGAK